MYILISNVFTTLSFGRIVISLFHLTPLTIPIIDTLIFLPQKLSNPLETLVLLQYQNAGGISVPGYPLHAEPSQSATNQATKLARTSKPVSYHRYPHHPHSRNLHLHRCHIHCPHPQYQPRSHPVKLQASLTFHPNQRP